MGKYNFDYLIDKIKDAAFENIPFKHIYIDDFFSEDHFREIIESSEISSPIAGNDRELIDGLTGKGFKPISFPGCVTDIQKYISWHEGGKKAAHHSACEGFGMAFRLYEFPSEILKELNDFLASSAFNSAIAEKFEIKFDDCVIDGGIQKYLDGYEISPHPDIRKKAATFMVNINPSEESERLDHHTHYLKLKKPYAYVEEFWVGNQNVDRAWVPWEWAETVKQQSKNNSIVLFSPSDDTLHGVKASYNHMKTQRTQLYGNLWYKTNPASKTLEWEQLDLTNKVSVGLKRKVARMIPKGMRGLLRRAVKSDSVGKRNI